LKSEASSLVSEGPTMMMSALAMVPAPSFPSFARNPPIITLLAGPRNVNAVISGARRNGLLDVDWKRLRNPGRVQRTDGGRWAGRSAHSGVSGELEVHHLQFHPPRPLNALMIGSKARRQRRWSLRATACSAAPKAIPLSSEPFCRTLICRCSPLLPTQRGSSASSPSRSPASAWDCLAERPQPLQRHDRRLVQLVQIHLAVDPQPARCDEPLSALLAWALNAAVKAGIALTWIFSPPAIACPPWLSRCDPQAASASCIAKYGTLRAEPCPTSRPARSEPPACGSGPPRWRPRSDHARVPLLVGQHDRPLGVAVEAGVLDQLAGPATCLRCSVLRACCGRRGRGRSRGRGCRPPR